MAAQCQVATEKGGGSATLDPKVVAQQRLTPSKRPLPGLKVFREMQKAFAQEMENLVNTVIVSSDARNYRVVGGTTSRVAPTGLLTVQASHMIYRATSAIALVDFKHNRVKSVSDADACESGT